MADQNDHNLYQIERGNRATSIKATVMPFVNEKIQAAVGSMVAMYRGGDIRPDVLIGKVGEISILMSLMAELDVSQAKGLAAMQRETPDA